MSLRPLKALLLFLCLLLPLFAEERVTKEQHSTRFTFDDDGYLDLSGYLSQAYGFLPVPVLITEPAVGYGGGMALVYLHDKFAGLAAENGRKIPPSVSGALLAATQNGTKVAALFHAGYYFEDRLRTQTFALLSNININFYTPKEIALFLNLKIPVFYQSLKYRVSDQNIFIGLSYLYISSATQRNDTDSPTDLQPSSDVSAAVGLIFDYDTRNNTLSPDRGTLLNLRASLFEKFFGSQSKFQRYLAQELIYIPLSKNLHFDHRLGFETVVGEEAPFYFYPMISMRGVPAMRYQGESVALYEMQLGYEFTKRWRALVFGGIAKAYGHTSSLLKRENISFWDAKSVFSQGIGFRYLIAKRYGLRMGVDIARSNEDSALYIQFGTAWMGL